MKQINSSVEFAGFASGKPKERIFQGNICCGSSELTFGA